MPLFRPNPSVPTVANTVYYSLGDARRFAAIGAKGWKQGPDWLLFAYPPSKGTFAVRITQFGHDLGHDTYRMDFYAHPPNSARGVSRSPFVKVSVAGLYADQLRRAFVEQTGLPL